MEPNPAWSCSAFQAPITLNLRNQFRPRDLVQHQSSGSSGVELGMNSRIDSRFEFIDHKTCRSICDAVGERLQQSLPPPRSELPTHLKRLMDELRRRDGGDFRMSS
jgi:hypothetical protein